MDANRLDQLQEKVRRENFAPISTSPYSKFTASKLQQTTRLNYFI